MAKSSSRHSAKNGTKTSSKRSASKSVNNPRVGRPAVMTPKAGVTVDRRRVRNGGELCW